MPNELAKLNSFVVSKSNLQCFDDNMNEFMETLMFHELKCSNCKDEKFVTYSADEWYDLLITHKNDQFTKIYMNERESFSDALLLLEMLVFSNKELIQHAYNHPEIKNHSISSFLHHVDMIYAEWHKYQQLDIHSSLSSIFDSFEPTFDAPFSSSQPIIISKETDEQLMDKAADQSKKLTDEQLMDEATTVALKKQKKKTIADLSPSIQKEEKKKKTIGDLSSSQKKEVKVPEKKGLSKLAPSEVLSSSLYSEEYENPKLSKKEKEDIIKVGKMRTQYNVEEIAKMLDYSFSSISPMVAQSIMRSTTTWSAFQNLNESNGLNDEKRMNAKITEMNLIFEKKKTSGQLHGLAEQVSHLIGDPRIHQTIDESLIDSMKVHHDNAAKEKREKEEERGMNEDQKKTIRKQREEASKAALKKKLPTEQAIQAMSHQTVLSSFHGFTEHWVSSIEKFGAKYKDPVSGRSVFFRTGWMLGSIEVGNLQPVLTVFALFSKILMKLTNPQFVSFMSLLLNKVPKMPTALELARLAGKWIDKLYPVFSPLNPILYEITKYSQPIWDAWASQCIGWFILSFHNILNWVKNSDIQLRTESEINNVFVHMIRLFSFLVRISESYMTVFYIWYLKVVWGLVKKIAGLFVSAITKIL